jgi:hypothetical protein
MKATIDARDVARRFTLVTKTKRYHEWQFRIWLGLYLIRIAAWIMWIDIEVQHDDE